MNSCVSIIRSLFPIIFCIIKFINKIYTKLFLFNSINISDYSISDEITFGPNKEIQTDAKQNEKEYTESTINRQGDSQFKDLPRNGEYQEPKIGFVAYGQPTDATKLEANLPAQDANKKSERYLVDFSIAEQRENWFEILLGTASEDKDSDNDGVPDVIDLS